MNKKSIWLLALFLLASALIKAQCGYLLVEKAAEEAGNDAIYIRDFKVKLSSGNMNEPSPTGKFPVYLNKGIQYRFTIANAEEFAGKARVEITRKGQTYSGNFVEAENKLLTKFDFLCEKSASYQVLINFGENREGCSAIVMSMVVPDSIVYIEPGIPIKSDSAEVLYLWSENELQIASSSARNAEMQVSISQGTLSNAGRKYIVVPEKKGDLTVFVKIYKDNQLTDSDSVVYQVVMPPLPNLEFTTESGGILSLQDFKSIQDTRLVHQTEYLDNTYKLKEFVLSNSINRLTEYHSNGDRLSSEQISMIKKLKPTDRLFIVRAIYIDPEGNLQTTSEREVYLRE